MIIINIYPCWINLLIKYPNLEYLLTAAFLVNSADDWFIYKLSILSIEQYISIDEAELGRLWIRVYFVGSQNLSQAQHPKTPNPNRKLIIKTSKDKFVWDKAPASRIAVQLTYYGRFMPLYWLLVSCQTKVLYTCCIYHT